MRTVYGNTILSLTRKCVVMKTSKRPPANRALTQEAIERPAAPTGPEPLLELQ